MSPVRHSAARRRRVLAASGLVGVAVAAAAAPGSDAATTGLPSAKALARLGYVVSWPVKANPSTIDASSTLVVRVSWKKKRVRPHNSVQLSMRDMTPGSVVTPRLDTLRRGTFQIGELVPGHSYRLRMRIGKLMVTTRIDTAAAVVTPPVVPAPTPVPTPAPAPVDPLVACGGALPASITPTLSSTAIRTGSDVTFTAVNPGPSCIVSGTSVIWQRLEGTRWNAVQGISYPTIAQIIPAGGTFAATLHAGPQITPGHYRLAWTYSAATPDGVRSDGASAELDVAAG